MGLLKITWDSLRFKRFVRFAIWAFCWLKLALVRVQERDEADELGGGLKWTGRH